MNIIKYNYICTILLCTAVAFGQKHTKKINESFKVNNDVLVEIDARHSDITVKTWNKNIVSVAGVWEVEGMTEEASKKYFKNWKFEALGNKSKVVITSKSYNNYSVYTDIFDDFKIATHITGVVTSNLPTVPPMPAMTPMSHLPPMPPFPAPAIGHLNELQFDYEAYQKDKEGYMKDFEKRQEVWEKEFEEKFEPQMKAYEKQMKEWQKKIEPQMKAYEEKMKQWEKEIAPQMKMYEKKMEVQAKKLENKLQQMEKEMAVKYAKKMKEKRAKMSKYNIKKKLVIKVPNGATLKVDSRYGKISLPDNIKTIN